MGQKNNLLKPYASKEIISDSIVLKNIEQMIRMIYSFSKDTKNDQVGTALAKELGERLDIFLTENQDLI